MHTSLRWKGKLVSKSVYDRNVRFSAVRRSRKSVAADEPNLEESPKENSDVAENAVNRSSITNEEAVIESSINEEVPVANESCSEEEDPIEGRRIVELGWMAKRMICDCCRGDLLLRNIENETQNGFASILHIRCEWCLLVNMIPTGKNHVPDGKRRVVYDVNTKIVLGALHTGMGHAHINKLMRTINVPTMPSSTFKRREREIGKVVEKIAKESCKKAAAEERNLTIKNSDELQKLL